MNFDSIVPLLFILAFFILPSILRQVRARKKRAGKPLPVKKKVSILDRVSEQVQKFVQEIENQARQQESQGPARESGSLWDVLAEEDPLSPGKEPLPDDGEDVDDAAARPGPATRDLEPEPVKPVLRPATGNGKDRSCREKPFQRRSGDCRLKAHPLQNAVVWSEILSKPLALRDR